MSLGGPKLTYGVVMANVCFRQQSTHQKSASSIPCRTEPVFFRPGRAAGGVMIQRALGEVGGDYPLTNPMRAYMSADRARRSRRWP
jgi:hypothetical protein